MLFNCKLLLSHSNCWSQWIMILKKSSTAQLCFFYTGLRKKGCWPGFWNTLIRNQLHQNGIWFFKVYWGWGIVTTINDVWNKSLWKNENVGDNKSGQEFLIFSRSNMWLKLKPPTKQPKSCGSRLTAQDPLAYPSYFTEVLVLWQRGLNTITSFQDIISCIVIVGGD